MQRLKFYFDALPDQERCVVRLLLFLALGAGLIWNACRVVMGWDACPLPLRGGLLFASVFISLWVSAVTTGWPLCLLPTEGGTAGWRWRHGRADLLRASIALSLFFAAAVTFTALDMARTASYTALIGAVQRHDVGAMRAVLARGISPDTRPWNTDPTDTPCALYEAMDLGDTQMAQALLDAGARPTGGEFVAAGGPLMLAAGHGDAAMLKVLLTRGDVVIPSKDRHLALTFLARQDNAPCVRVLLDAGGGVDLATRRYLLRELFYTGRGNGLTAKYLRQQPKPSRPVHS